MAIFLATFFTFNLVASILVVHYVFPRLQALVKAGTIPRGLKLYGLASLILEGAVALVSFLQLFDTGGNIAGYPLEEWLLAAYAFANANVYLWAFLFHKLRWRVHG